MRTLILALALFTSLGAAAQGTSKVFSFKLMSVTCQLQNGRFVTATCKTIDGKWKNYCSLDHMGTTHSVSAEQMKTGKYDVASVGPNQYITFAENADGATVCDGAGSDGQKIIVTGEMIDQVTASDLKP